MSGARRRKMQINVEVPAELDATYSNFAMITHTASEIVLDFACVLPNSPKAKVHARIVTTPASAKALIRALSENLEKYEAQYGEVGIAGGDDGLAQQFFGQAGRPPAGDT